MTKNRKKTVGIIAFVVVIIIAIISYNNYNSYQKEKQKQNLIQTQISNKKAALVPIYELIKTQYFAKGTYNDYKALFTKPSIVLPKAQFEVNQKTNKPSDVFLYDSKTPESIMKHMKLIEQVKGGNTYMVYYLKNVNDIKNLKQTTYWVVTKKDGKWLIKND